MSPRLPILFLSLLYLAKADVLTRATGCPNVLDYYKRNALERVGPYGFSPFPPIRFHGPVLLSKGPVAASAPQAAPAPAVAPPEAGVDFSETNVQVEGVDEPDIVKTDGTRVFVIRGKKFFVVDVTDGGASGRESGSLTLPTFASEMLIDEDRVLVISRDFGFLEKETLITKSSAKRFIPFPYRPRPPLTTIYQISVAGPKPTLIATLRMEGRYVSSREVDGIARIVMTYDPTPYIPFKIHNPRPIFPGPILPGPIPLASARAAKSTDRDIYTKRNQDVIRATTINTWLPQYVLKTECSPSGCAREYHGLVSECDDVFLPSEKFTGFGLLTVATLKIFGTLKPRNSVSIASDSGDVYSTATRLYVANTEYRYDFPENSIRLGATFRTFLHKFRLTQNGAFYGGSGSVSGSVLNQFSMHEHNRVFFVATTEGAPWWRARDTSKSKITAFKDRGFSLVRIGEVGNLGIGERIFAVRYITTTAYVVTFRRIDPLYIIDLSNPYRLRVTGELKIPGFSSYLHPIGNGRLLGVGQDATPEGRTTGAKVSLFDVSDVTNPQETASWTLPGSFTSAQFDHRAFLFWKPESVAVLPVSVYSREASERFTGSIVLEVSDADIVERGRIKHMSSSSFSPRIERNFVLGRTHLWSLSSELLQVNRITDLEFESRVPLPR